MKRALFLGLVLAAMLGGISPARALPQHVVTGMGQLSTGESFLLDATESGGLLVLRSEPEADPVTVTLDCVRFSWVLLPTPTLRYFIHLGGTGSDGRRHQAIFYDFGPASSWDLGTLTEPGSETCGTTLQGLPRIRGFVNAAL